MNHTGTSAKVEKVVKNILLVIVVITLLYLFIYAYFNPKGISIPLLIIFLLLPVIVIVLNWFKKFTLSKHIGLIGFNIALFLVASSEPIASGVYLHFVSCCAVSIVLFRYTERWKSFLYIALSVSLFLTVNLFTLDLLPFRELPKEVSTAFFISHTIGAALISTLCFYLVLGNKYKALINLSQKNKELKRVNEQLDQFAYRTSHNLRSPIASSIGLVRLINDADSEDKAHFLSLLEMSLGSLDGIIQEIQDVFKVDKLENRYDEFIIQDLILKTFEDQKFQVDKSNIEYFILPEKPVKIISDINKVKIILNNLISNAIKFSPVSKKITFLVDTNKHEAKVSVQDNGFGIEENRVTKIFDMFYRGNDKVKGTGLGLYIVKTALDKLNGNIEVESIIDEGTKFTFTIPIEKSIQ